MDSMRTGSARRLRKAGVLLALVLLSAAASLARASWSFEVSTGSAWNVWTPLVIRQTGYPDIALNGRCLTRPFSEVPYYDLRLGRDFGGSRFELELVHHKLYLEDRPPEVQDFEVTHGFNFITVNLRRPWLGFGLRAGVGMVLAHPQTVIRGMAFPGHSGFLGLGWYVSGAVAQAAVDRGFRLSSRFDIVVEGKVTGAAARVPIVDGTTDIENLALHGLAGIRYRI